MKIHLYWVFKHASVQYKMTFGLHNCEQSAKAVRESALLTYSAALPQDVFDNSESFFQFIQNTFFSLPVDLNPQTLACHIASSTILT